MKSLFFCFILAVLTSLSSGAAGRGGVGTWYACGSEMYQGLCQQLDANRGSDSLVHSLIEAKEILFLRNEPLYRELLRAEEEFRDLARDIFSSYAITREIQVRGKESNLERERFAYQSITILTYPRRVILSGFGRSAISFPQERVILFDYEYWGKASPKEKSLIVLTEIMRFQGVEDEEERYQAASEILTVIAQQKYDIMNFRLTPTQGGFEIFDRNKIFVGGILPDQSGYAIVNFQSPMLNYRSCRKEKPSMSSIEESQKQALRSIRLIQPEMLEVCQQWILERRQISIRLATNSGNHMVVNCGPL